MHQRNGDKELVNGCEGGEEDKVGIEEVIKN